MPSRLSIRASLACAAALAMTAGVAGCGSDSGSDSGSSKGTQGSAISAGRCAENKAAGKITYLSGYQYQSSVSILEYIAAAKLGYFKDLCLDVTLKPGTGDTAQSTKLLASGQATVSPVSEQDVIQARANGIDITGISSYSNSGLDILMTNKDITELPQLDGKVVGHKGYMPATVRAMLVKAGVKYDSLKLVKQGYDPSVLPRRQGGLAALTGFVSNEPNQLKAAGKPVTVWQPAEFGVPGSLGAMAVNPAFAAKHPHAVEDILRAALHAYDYCTADATKTAECVGYAADLSGPTYDTKLNTTIWNTETQIVKSSPTPGQPRGGIDTANVKGIVEMLRQFDIVTGAVTPAGAEKWFDGSFVKNVHDGDKLVWPAP